MVVAMLALGGMVQDAAAGEQVIAYVFPQEQPISPEGIAAQQLTRINYAFARMHDGRVELAHPLDADNLAALVALKQKNPRLTVLISVGGWLGSGEFSEMAATAEGRSAFLQSALELIEQQHLDGIDIDWEYPGMEGAQKHFRPEDKQNFTLLLQELRAGLDREGARLHRRLYLSIAAGVQPEYLEHTEMARVQKYVDTVNLMAYDYYEPGDQKITGNHAPLYADPDDPDGFSADRSVQAFEQAGVPARKLVLGVPFYGHIWGKVQDVNHGLFQPGRREADGFISYAQIASTLLGHGYTRYWDAAAAAPYLYNPRERIFVSYEDPESLARKCEYVRQHQLGGVMFWSYEGDPSGTLLGAIHTHLPQAGEAYQKKRNK